MKATKFLKGRSNKVLLATLSILLFGILFHYRYRILSEFQAPPQRAFYFWKTQWVSNRVIEEQIQKSQATKIYMRFFDVEWDSFKNQSRPVSPIEFLSAPPQNVEIVPVVYITNAVFIRSEYKDVELLSERVWNKVKAIADSQKISFKQIQLDCDWSGRSRRNYFHFLDLLRRKRGTEGYEISSTIRLHQIKYAERTGVPPVNRGMLMFYNFGRIQADSPRSSIFNVNDASLYTPHISQYKLPLDLVLPIFSWVIHSRDNKVLELLDIGNFNELLNVGFEQTAPLRFVARKSFFYHGKYFAEGDLLSVEESTPKNTEDAAQLALKGSAWKKSFHTVAFFDLDERNLNRYGNSEIEKIFEQF
ncbi:MAG: hypothetical protein KA116_12275 [Proteobacteria bacterium]|nr:hypothetical protein [Pseudomonadota bacterium]